MYVINGASGNTGRIISEKLLAAGKKVRVIGRDSGKLQPLVNKGAKAMPGSLEDAAFLKKAFAGATAVYVLVPPKFDAPDFRKYQQKVVENIAAALEANDVKYALTLSSQGADLPEGTGPITGLHDMEQRLNKIAGLNVLHLRATYFMENWYNSLDMIRNMNINGTPARPDVRVPMIAARDIGEYAAKRLLALDFSGHGHQDLLGPKDYSMTEAHTILAKAIGKPDLPYVQFPYDQAQQAMEQMGLSGDLAGKYIEMYRALNDGKALKPRPRDKENTTPTTLETFAQQFAAAFKS